MIRFYLNTNYNVFLLVFLCIAIIHGDQNLIISASDNSYLLLHQEIRKTQDLSIYLTPYPFGYKVFHKTMIDPNDNNGFVRFVPSIKF